MSKSKSVKQYLQKSKILTEAYRSAKTTLEKTKHGASKISRAKNVSQWGKYKNYVLNHQLDKSDYVQITEEPYSGTPSKKLIAYYLPQYYQIPQNDAWFGRGFTEWSNCAKAVPQFAGHWQPHLPIDVGFYNLENSSIMHRQVELAKMYGLSGFCFYYYWFSGGAKIMEKPINNWLNDKKLDFPFMLFWANEDWTNTWGDKADIGTKTYSAKMKKSDVKKFVNDIAPFLKDSRYIKIDGRPHIIIYQAKKDPFLREFIRMVGEQLASISLKKPYISLVFPDDFDEKFDPRDYGADAVVEFGSHLKQMPPSIPQKTTNKKIVNPLAKITEYDMEEFINAKGFVTDLDFPVYKSVMTTFDNTARKIYSGAQLFQIQPALYQKWLTESIEDSEEDHIFITAWNEWAEGMHLEPDQKYGYAYLQATKNALETANHKSKNN